MVSLSGFFPNILRGLFPAAERRDRNPGEKRAEEKDGERRSPGTAFRCASHDEKRGRAKPLDAAEDEHQRGKSKRPSLSDEEDCARNEERRGAERCRHSVKEEMRGKKRVGGDGEEQEHEC